MWELGTREPPMFPLLPLWPHRGLPGSHTTVLTILLKGQIPSLPDLKLPAASYHTWNKIQSPCHDLGTLHDGGMLYQRPPSFSVHHFSHTDLPDVLQTFQASSFANAFAKCLLRQSYIH